MSVAPVSSGARQPNPILLFVRSSIGKKWIVGVSGALLILFLLAHLAGNLTIYLGKNGEGINIYAQTLHTSQLFLWGARLGLLAVFLVHIRMATALAHENKRARPQRYAVKAHVQSSVFARTMILSGIVVLSFAIFHVLQFAAGVNSHSHLVDSQGRHDVASMIILSFRSPLVSGFYLLSLGLLGMHLSHGVSSVFQTFGLNGRKTAVCVKRFALVASWGLMAAFASIPVACLTGFLQPSPSAPQQHAASASFPGLSR